VSNEKPLFFENRDGKRLFGILHRPEPDTSRVGPAVVYCAPLFEEKLWSHRIAVNLARPLARQGTAVFRFDYFGDGESEGRFEDASVVSRLADIRDAVNFCRKETGATRVFLLGLRYGGTLALLAALDFNEVDGAVGWAPVMDGERYMGEILRAHLSNQMVVHRKILQDRDALVEQIKSGSTVNVEGYEIGEALYAQVRGVDLGARLRGGGKPLLIMQISPSDRVEPQYKELAGLRNPLVTFEQVREERIWVQPKMPFPPCTDLFELTRQWLAAAA
jgi:alpha/beta superfamily hydrolase